MHSAHTHHEYIRSAAWLYRFDIDDNSHFFSHTQSLGKI